jgi:hypothetical protein
MAITPIIARRDLKMRARITSSRQLVYEGEPTATPDRPRQVRTGSGLAWTGDRMVVIQDDADYIAVIQEAGGVAALPLRGTQGSRFGKPGTAHLNLEAVLSAKDWRGDLLLAFGSGKSDDRRNVARVRLGGGDTEMSVFETRKLYEAMAQPGGLTGGARPNIQGVALVPKAVDGRDAVRVFHHGSGSSSSEDRNYDATAEFRLDSLLAYLDRSKRDPSAFLGFELAAPRHYDLDDYEGLPFHFTDAAPVPGEGARVVFTALARRAEGTGAAVAAVAVGVIEADGSARYTIAVERDGTVAERNVQGLALSGRTAGYLVVDGAADESATLASIELTGL